MLSAVVHTLKARLALQFIQHRSQDIKMGIQNKLAAGIDEVDIIIAGGT
jgi:hypothetical protein